jgi:flagellar biosynthetic protein FliP
MIKRLYFCVFWFVMVMQPLYADKLTLNLNDGSFSARVLTLMALLTVLSLAPSILVMVTSFTRIVVVLSMLRHAIGLGQSPPNSVLISLALFLTFFTMHTTLNEAYERGVEPYLAAKISEEKALDRVADPFRTFMLKHVGKREMEVFMDIAKIDKIEAPKDTPFRVLIPAFMLSELRRAFEIGFLLFIPFMVIDLVVASVIMSMGMMMLPPMMLSLPFKVIFFVLSDGWTLLAASLVRSYS